MNKGKLGAVLAAVSMLCAVPAQADPMSGAEKLRRLDIMLMVTGLRCRTGADDFQADFQQFEGHHIAELNDAARQLKAGLVHQFGAAGAEREMDRISVTMANRYGNGHPWLGCHELKSMAHTLAGQDGLAPLIEAADETLFDEGADHLAMAR